MYSNDVLLGNKFMGVMELWKSLGKITQDLIYNLLKFTTLLTIVH